MGALKIVYDGAALHELLSSPTGPMGVFLIERGEMVKTFAKTNIGEMTDRHTGCLQDTVVKRFAADGPLLSVIIQSDTSPCSPDHKSYSLFVHEGTRPHIINARPGGVLAFQSHGQTVFATSVNHPGTAPRPFLRRALEQVAATV
jgi:hypothetical protein